MALVEKGRDLMNMQLDTGTRGEASMNTESLLLDIP